MPRRTYAPGRRHPSDYSGSIEKIAKRILKPHFSQRIGETAVVQVITRPETLEEKSSYKKPEII